jgi:rod shape-determining protein MreD
VGVAVLLALTVLASAVPDLAPGFLSIDAHPPDLWLASAVYLVLRGRGFAPLPWVIALGLARDCLSVDPLGTHAFVLGAVGFVLARRRSGSAPPDGAGRAAVLFAASLCASALYVLRLLPVAEARPPASALLDAFPVALWTTLAAAPLYALLDRTRALDGLAGRTRAFSS